MINSSAAPARLITPRSRCMPAPCSVATTARDPARLNTATEFPAPMGCTILPQSSPASAPLKAMTVHRVGPHTCSAAKPIIARARRLNMAPATPPSWTTSEVSSRHSWPRAIRVQLRSRLFKSQGAIVNWARVGIPTMIMATVVAHGHRARGGAANGRTREAANAVASTIAYSTDSSAVVTLSILPVNWRQGIDLDPARWGELHRSQIPKASSARTMAPDSSKTPATSDGVTRPLCGGRERAARQ
jgi:hypothetical protein